MLQHDTLLRAAARAIYDACYPGDEWAPLGFEDAERYATVHYRQAVGAAIEARRCWRLRCNPICSVRS